jgi:hypothetical protein
MDATECDHVLRGHEQDPGLIARMASVEKSLSEIQARRKWLIGMALGIAVNVSIAAAQLLLK